VGVVPALVFAALVVVGTVFGVPAWEPVTRRWAG